MSTEINTRGMVRSKVASFPAGNDAECLSKTEILSQSGQDTYVGGSYGNTECARIDDVKQISGIYSGSYFFIDSDGTNTDASATEAHVSISNGVATIHFVDIWMGWIGIGDITLRVNIENGVLKNLISWDAPMTTSLASVDLNLGAINGLIFNIDLSMYIFFGDTQMKFTGTKQ